jgi:hypothetical protein
LQPFNKQNELGGLNELNLEEGMLNILSITQSAEIIGHE